MSDWNTDMSAAPAGIPLEVKVGEGMIFHASLAITQSMDGDGNICDQWQATHEGEHPPCWTEGACWQENEDQVASLQPIAWRHIQGEGVE